MFGHRRDGGDDGRGRSRPPRPGRAASQPVVGIGALVAVTSKLGEPDQWIGEPVGLVIAIGANEVYGYPGIGRPRFWTVAFSGFEWMADGRGPFEEALIPEWRLEVLEAEPSTSFDEPELRAD